MTEKTNERENKKEMSEKNGRPMRTRRPYKKIDNQNKQEKTERVTKEKSARGKATERKTEEVGKEENKIASRARKTTNTRRK